MPCLIFLRAIPPPFLLPGLGEIFKVFYLLLQFIFVQLDLIRVLRETFSSRYLAVLCSFDLIHRRGASSLFHPKFLCSHWKKYIRMLCLTASAIKITGCQRL